MQQKVRLYHRLLTEKISSENKKLKNLKKSKELHEATNLRSSVTCLEILCMQYNIKVVTPKYCDKNVKDRKQKFKILLTQIQQEK